MAIGSERTWFARAEAWAESISNNPVVWLTRIRDAELLAHGALNDEECYGQLVNLLVHYITIEREATRHLTTDDGACLHGNDRPPLPMYIDIVKAIQSALVRIGPRAAPQLIEIYRGLPQDAPEGIWILTVLAEIGGAAARTVIDGLHEAELVEMIRSEWGIGPPRTAGPASPNGATDEELISEARQTIERFRMTLLAKSQNPEPGATPGS